MTDKKTHWRNTAIKETMAWLQVNFNMDIVPPDEEIVAYAIKAYQERAK